MAQVRRRGQVVFACLIDVERKLCANVRVMILGIADTRSEFLAEIREFHGYRGIDQARMSDGIPDVVGEGTDRKRQFVRVLSVAEEALHEIGRSHLVR